MSFRVPTRSTLSWACVCCYSRPAGAASRTLKKRASSRAEGRASMTTPEVFRQGGHARRSPEPLSRAYPVAALDKFRDLDRASGFGRFRNRQRHGQRARALSGVDDRLFLAANDARELMELA